MLTPFSARWRSKIKGHLAPKCAPCEAPLGQPKSEFGRQICAAVILASVSFILPVVTVLGMLDQTLVALVNIDFLT